MAREGAKIDFFGESPSPSNAASAPTPQRSAIRIACSNGPGPTPWLDEEGDLGRNLAAAFAGAARAFAPLSGRVLSVLGIVRERRRPRPLA